MEQEIKFLLSVLEINKQYQDPKKVMEVPEGMERDEYFAAVRKRYEDSVKESFPTAQFQIDTRGGWGFQFIARRLF